MFKSKALSCIRLLKSRQGGAILLEALVALAVLGATGVAFVSALGTTTKATVIMDERALAESLVRSQLEYVKNYTYQAAPTTYPVNPALTFPGGWTMPATVGALVHGTDDGIQKVTVQVVHRGETVLSAEMFKVHR